MKMVKMSILAAAIVLSASAAQAATPPYHINASADYYVGKGIVQFAGGCKTKAVYENAQYGQVLDSTDAYVGWGMVANGEIVVLEENYHYFSGFADSVTLKTIDTYYENMASAETIAAVESAAGCDVGALISSASSKETYTVYPAKSLDGYVAQFPFTGFTAYTTVKKDNNTKTYYKSQKIIGKITFKGSKAP